MPPTFPSDMPNSSDLFAIFKRLGNFLKFIIESIVK